MHIHRVTYESQEGLRSVWCHILTHQCAHLCVHLEMSVCAGVNNDFLLKNIELISCHAFRHIPTQA